MNPQRGRMLRRLAADQRFVAGAAVVLAFAVAALLAPALAPPDAAASGGSLEARFLAPLVTGPDGSPHPLGTDGLGRDVLSRLLFGARVSLAVGVLAASLAAVVGIAAGALAGYAGGTADRVIVAITDAALSVPRVPLLLLLVALFAPSILLVVLALGLTGWMTVARLVRAEVRSVRERPFVDSARALGVRPARVLALHILPNALTGALVATALGVGNAIMLEAGLSFLGLGVQPPTPSWGNMIASGRDALMIAPWIATVPGLAVALVVLGFSLVADALQDALAPRGG